MSVSSSSKQAKNREDDVFLYLDDPDFGLNDLKFVHKDSSGSNKNNGSLYSKICLIKYSDFNEMINRFHDIPQYMVMRDKERFSAISKQMKLDTRYFYFIVPDSDMDFPFNFVKDQVTAEDVPETRIYSFSCRSIEQTMIYAERIYESTKNKISFSPLFVERVKEQFYSDFSAVFQVFVSTRLPRPSARIIDEIQSKQI